MSSASAAQADRPEYANELAEAGDIADAARPLSFWERLWNNQAVRRSAILIGFALLWEFGARASDSVMLCSAALLAV